MHVFGKRQLITLLTNSVRSLPAVAPVGLTTFGVVTVALLMLNQFYLLLLLLLGVPIAALGMWLAFRLTSPESEQSRQPLITDFVAVLGIILWAIINIPFSAQHILTDRDPATYAVAGAWLATHHDLHIPVPAAFASLPNMTAVSFGFNLSALQPREIYAQGAHLLPALLGVSGKIFGQAAMLHFNVLFGAVALLAFYGFARQVLKPASV